MMVEFTLVVGAERPKAQEAKLVKVPGRDDDDNGDDDEI